MDDAFSKMVDAIKEKYPKENTSIQKREKIVRVLKEYIFDTDQVGAEEYFGEANPVYIKTGDYVKLYHENEDLQNSENTRLQNFFTIYLTDNVGGRRKSKRTTRRHKKSKRTTRHRKTTRK